MNKLNNFFLIKKKKINNQENYKEFESKILLLQRVKRSALRLFIFEGAYKFFFKY